MTPFQRIVRDMGGLALVVGLLVLVTFLPPDTSLREVQQKATLRACVPASYPPLVTGDPARPGIDIEILESVADRLGVRLVLSPNDAMGRDFNPRNWAITRGRCEVIAGGVVDSRLTRSFLDTGPAYAQTGWAVLAPAPVASVDGLALGALTVISGLDRIGLASYLRAHDATVRVLRSRDDLVADIADGELDGGVTETLLARAIAAETGLWVAQMPDELARYNLVVGLWKGDLTLKRAIVRAFRDIGSDGTLAGILARYGAAPDDALPTL